MGGAFCYFIVFFLHTDSLSQMTQQPDASLLSESETAVGTVRFVTHQF